MDDKEQSAIDALRAAGLEAEASAVEALRARHSRLTNDFLAGQRDSYRNGQAAERERFAPLMQAVELLLDAGHMDTEHLARLRAAWEAS